MAIALAGGYTYRARKNEFVVTQVDGDQYIGNHQAPILRGDLIEVYERYF